MSLNQLIEDTYKPWLNIRVNNLTVDGTFSGSSESPSVTATNTINPGNVNPIVTTVTLTPSMLPSTGIWYSAQFITFISVLDNSASKKSIADVIFYVDPAGNISNIATAPSNVPYPTVGSFNFDLTYTSTTPSTITSTVTNLNNVPAYKLALVVSDVRPLI